VLLVESLALGGRALERREQIVSSLVAAVDEGRAATKAGRDLPPLIAEGNVGGALSILGARAGQREAASFSEMLNPLMGMIVMPYLGAAAARRELDRPVAAREIDARRHTPSHDPFKSAGMRLTYRTARVLLAVAEHPGVSNRQLGDLAEIRDQGQISKLLRRLEKLELIANSDIFPGQGAPNAWELTGAGIQLTGSIRAHTEADR
jgi:hypothetical protein